MKNINPLSRVIIRFIDTLNLEGLEAVDSYTVLFEAISEEDRQQIHAYIQSKIDEILNSLEEDIS